MVSDSVLVFCPEIVGTLGFALKLDVVAVPVNVSPAAAGVPDTLLLYAPVPALFTAATRKV